MLTDRAIRKYIKDNNGTGIYELADSGDGDFIYRWEMDIDKPTDQQLIDAESNAPPDNVYVPSDLEIRLDALEKKSGITQADKDASRQALIDAKS